MGSKKNTVSVHHLGVNTRHPETDPRHGRHAVMILDKGEITGAVLDYKNGKNLGDHGKWAAGIAIVLCNHLKIPAHVIDTEHNSQWEWGSAIFIDPIDLPHFRLLEEGIRTESPAVRAELIRLRDENEEWRKQNAR